MNKEHKDLHDAGISLTRATYNCAAAINEVERATSLTMSGAIATLQLANEAVKDALRRVLSETHALAEVQGLADIVAPTATPTGVPFDDQIDKGALSTRSYNSLRNGGIKTIRELCSLEAADMMKFRNFGRKSFDEIEAYRLQLGIPLI